MQLLTRCTMSCLVYLAILLSSSALVIGNAKITQLESYNSTSAAVCIVIPPRGEDYEITPASLTADENGNVSSDKKPTSKREADGRQVIDDNWLWTQPDDLSVAIATLQFYVVSNITNVIFWAGQSKVPPQLLVPGKHILSYEVSTTPYNELDLAVWWNNEPLQVDLKREVLKASRYLPHHVSLFGPSVLKHSARALCYDDLPPAASTPERQASTLGLVAGAVLLALLTLAVVSLLLVKRFCRTDSLKVAGEEAPPEKSSNSLAGANDPPLKEEVTYLAADSD